jgi:soluble lytic murein transglycosylase-like protein
MGFAWRHKLIAAAAALLLAAPLFAGEQVVLRTGFRLRAERHAVSGATTRVFLAGGGWVDVVSEEIAGFEAEPDAATPVVVAPQPRSPETLEEIIRLAAEKHGLDPDFIRAVIAAESAGNARAVSPKGALGLMQLMPGTAQDLGLTDVFDAAQNVNGGAAYLRQMLDKFGLDAVKALAAYNAGPAKVEAYKGIPPYRETQKFVRRVIEGFNQQKAEKRQSRSSDAESQ